MTPNGNADKAVIIAGNAPRASTFCEKKTRSCTRIRGKRSLTTVENRED